MQDQTESSSVDFTWKRKYYSEIEDMLLYDLCIEVEVNHFYMFFSVVKKSVVSYLI